MPDACKSPSFRCSYKTVSDGISQLQRYIRMHGAVITRIRVTDDFMQFFRANPAGVYSSNDTSTSGRRSFLHAVQLIGYNNEERFFLAKNSLGAAWGDEGLFRIGYGTAEVGHPEDTYTLLDCFTTSSDPDVVAAWSNRWSLQPDLSSTDDCFIYEANGRDTISGIVDHFQVDILAFVDANTRRGVIKTVMLGDPPRPEPQLQPETTWAGVKFQVCNIPNDFFDRVAKDPCTATPNYCNGRQTSCVAGRCVCPVRFAGRFCEQDLGVQLNLTVAGQLHVLHLEPRLPWIDAQKRCERDGLRLARLFSRLHAIEVQRQVRQIRGKHYFKMWIGLNDRKQEGRFEWVGSDSGSAGGVAPGFGMWKEKQPDDFEGGEDCVEMWWTGHSLDYPFWNDLPCTQAEAFMCAAVEESTDPCVTHPCSFAGSRPPVGCVSAGAAAASGSYGRQCLCEAPLECVSDELGCVEPLRFDSFSFELAGARHTLFIEPESSWTEAARICGERGMSLVKITSEEHADTLHAVVLGRLANRGGRKSYWIGLSDMEREGTFVWASDGSIATNSSGGFTRWLPGDPNNNCQDQWGTEPCAQEGEDCAMVWESGVWIDAPRWEQVHFVCAAATNA